MKKYDVAIIGAGTAGLSARKQLAKKTDNYVLIDNGKLGTTCARVGCMPSKALIHAANTYHLKKNHASLGILGSENLSINIAQVMQHVRQQRDRFVKSITEDMQNWQEEHLVQKRAKLIDAHTLSLGDETISAEKIIIATGSSPRIPKDWQHLQEFFLDTDSFFEQKNFPKKMAVIGQGVIGIELGQALRRLGIDVIAIGKKRSIANLSDPELVNASVNSMAKEINFDFSGVKEMAKQDNQLEIKTNDGMHRVDKALIAIGRSPNLNNLGLEHFCKNLNQHGVPAYDPHSFQLIEAKHIFIAGDVNQERTILHEAADEGKICGYNAVASKVKVFKRRTALSITFSDPNIAVIGESYQQLKDKSVEFVTGQVSFEGQGRSIIMQQEIGMLNIYADKESAQLLGAELFAPAGEHLAHLLAWIIDQKMTVNNALKLPFYHPVVAEGLRTALRNASSKLSVSKTQLELKLCED